MDTERMFGIGDGRRHPVRKSLRQSDNENHFDNPTKMEYNKQRDFFGKIFSGGEMISQLDYFRQLNIESVLLRLVLSMLFGGLIGIERGKKGRAAGFRTYMLVCLGATLSGILSQYIFVMLNTKWSHTATALSRSGDISRIGSQVIGGVGFLGAGSILTDKKEIRGLTTASGLWASACVGIAIGAGFYEAVGLAFLLISLIFKIMPFIELAIVKNSSSVNLYIETESSNPIARIIRTMKQNRIQIMEMDITRKHHRVGMTCSVKLPFKIRREQLITVLSGISGILLIEELN